MDWTLIIVFQVLFQPSLSVMFTVEAEKTVYNSELGGDVVMGCSFQPKPANPSAKLKVTWHRLMAHNSVREVYQWDNEEQSTSEEYHDRVNILTEELQEGWTKLKISRLRINDSGIYQCLVQTPEGADYKSITLSVIAPYKVVTKSIEKAAVGDMLLLTCQSEGYPNTPVVWQDGHLQTISPNTSTVSTPDELFKVTSHILVSSSDKNNYTCSFTSDGNSATFHIPEEIPAAHAKHDALIILLSIGVIMAVIIIAVLLYQRRKGFHTSSKRNLLKVDGRVRTVTINACPAINKENEEERSIFSEDDKKENLRACLKHQYGKFHCTLDVEELSHRLQNNEGQPVNLQALIPEAGETIFLEGLPGSGKTSMAYILVSSWTEGPTHVLSSFLNLNILQLLLYVDCSTVKGDLFEEIMTQLSLKGNISTENELRTMLTQSNDTLLLLDGYREGNTLFDESLKRFLSERGECRVLLMTLQDHCPLLTETVQVLKLQAQIVKY